jgi:hypothetical protein
MFEVRPKKMAFKVGEAVSLETLGDNRWAYEEGPRLLILLAEHGLGLDGSNVTNIHFPPDKRWEFPYHEAPIAPEEIKRIKANITEGIEALVKNAKVAFLG